MPCAGKLWLLRPEKGLGAVRASASRPSASTRNPRKNRSPAAPAGTPTFPSTDPCALPNTRHSRDGRALDGQLCLVKRGRVKDTDGGAGVPALVRGHRHPSRVAGPRFRRSSPICLRRALRRPPPDPTALGGNYLTDSCFGRIGRIGRQGTGRPRRPPQYPTNYWKTLNLDLS